MNKGKIIITSTPKGTSTQKWLSDWEGFIKQMQLRIERLEKLKRILDDE